MLVQVLSEVLMTMRAFLPGARGHAAVWGAGEGAAVGCCLG